MKYKMETRGKSCFRITNTWNNKVIYTRDKTIISSCRDFNTQGLDGEYIFEFIANTPKAIEVLYLSGSSDET